MSPELKALIEKARNYRMTAQEIKEQAIDFAWGNAAVEYPDIPREGFVKAAEEMNHVWEEHARRRNAAINTYFQGETDDPEILDDLIDDEADWVTNKEVCPKCGFPEECGSYCSNPFHRKG